jgi:hypothetical protein
MNPSVTIKSARDATRLTFSDAVGESFVASLESAHFQARVVVSIYVSGPPSLLFDEMAREWRGWEGKKEWAALEDELRITASSDRTGHVAVVIAMRNISDPPDWRLQATLELEAGQLEELASAMKKLFSHAPVA